MRKVLATILIVMLALLGAPYAPADGAEHIASVNGNEYRYTLNPDGTACILEFGNYGDFSGELSMPDKIDGHSVTSIGDEAFAFCAGLTYVSIPEGWLHYIYQTVFLTTTRHSFSQNAMPYVHMFFTR